MQLFHRFRIDNVLFAVFAAFLIVLVTATMVTSYTLSARSQARSTSFYQQGMLLELNKEIAFQLKAVEQTSLALSLNSSFLDFLELQGDYYSRYRARIEVSRNYLSPIVNSSSFIQSIQVYMNDPMTPDANADVQFLPLKQLRAEPWYPLAEKADSVWVGEHTGTSSQGEVPVISFVRALSGPTNHHVGTLVVNVKLKALQALLTQDNKAAGRILLDTGGRLMMHTDTAPQAGKIEQLYREIEGDKGYKRLHLDMDGMRVGGDVLMVWSSVFPEGWTLIELTPWSSVTKSSLQLAEALAIVGAVAVLLALLVTLLLSRQFTAPVRELLALMNGYALNRTVRAFPNRYRNEFGSLFTGYRRLVERIDELYESLERQYKAQRKAEIQALQAMINPHFLYNTLDQLNWMAIESGHDNISRVLELMGRMFRIGLSNGASFITVQDELLHLECYLQIQQLKWQEGLEYTIVADPALSGCFLPKLTLQPFVENAIRHGFHGKSAGFVSIEAGPDVDQGILLRVTDNGLGIDPNWQMQPKRKTGGYGIRNVMERIESYFGAPYGVTIVPLPEGGTEVTVRIPRLDREPDAG